MNIKYYSKSVYKYKDKGAAYLKVKTMQQINKTTIDQIKQITIVAENCESFAVPASLILDADFLILDKRNKSDDYRTQSGYIKLANEAADIPEGENVDDTDRHTLGERLLGYCDVTAVNIMFKDGTSYYTYLPYDPLEESMHGSEIELSNCPSLEFDENNDLLLLFGDKSKQFKRVDNNYSDLILGWQKEFGNFAPDIIKGRLYGLNTFGNDYNRKFDITFKSCNVPGKTLHLRFFNVTDCDLNISFDQSYLDLCMSRTSNGKIYVDIFGTLTFFCSCVCIYGYDFDSDCACNKDYPEETFFKALYLTLPEDVMHDFARCEKYPRNAQIYIDHERILHALKCYLDGSLTKEYLHSWIYFYKSLIYACDYHNQLLKKVYAVLDILYYSLMYNLSETVYEKFVSDSYEQIKSLIRCRIN